MHKVMTRHRRLPRPPARTAPVPAAVEPSRRPAEGPATASGRTSPPAGTVRAPADGAGPCPATPPRPPRAHGRLTAPAPGGAGPRPRHRPPRTPVRTAPPSSGGAGRPGASPAAADNRPAGRAARGRGPAAPVMAVRGPRRCRRRPRPAASSRAPENGPPVAPSPPPLPTDGFAERLLAVLSGQRPVHAMLRHTAGQAYDELVRLAERGPLRTRGTRPVVRDIGWFEPRRGRHRGLRADRRR